MMEQYNRIKMIAERKGHRPIKEVLGIKTIGISASKSEVKEEVTLAVVHNDEESIVDPDQNLTVISPALARMLKEVPTVKHHEPYEDCLSQTEHKQLAADLKRYRQGKCKMWLAIILPNPFDFIKQVYAISEPKTVES